MPRNNSSSRTQAVLRVEKHHREDLVLAAAELQPQVVLDLARCVEDRPRVSSLGERAARQLHDRGDLGALGRAEALDPAELRGLGMQQAGQPAELVEQLLGELQHAGAGEAGAQQQRDQFDIGERRGAEREQLLARAGPRRECPWPW